MVGGPEKPWRSVRIWAGVSALLSSYLLVTAIQEGHVAGCGPASGCDDVLSSPWGYWLGLPVSAPALLMHGSIVAATFSDTAETPADVRKKARLFLAAAACVLVAAASWFVGLQLFVLQSFCAYCLLAHASGAVTAFLILRATGNPLRVAAVRNAALLAVAVLVGGRWLNVPATHEVAIAAPARRETSRQMDLFDGMYKIELGAVPLIGEQDARSVVVSLFDYTCPHCRRMHGLLVAAEEKHRGRLVIADLPTPFDAACNPSITQTPPAHVNACAYARLGLTVCRADRDKTQKFSAWVFEPETPPSLESARSYAEQLVGREAFVRASQDPWVEAQLAQDVAIYQTTSSNFRNGAMPQLVIGTKVVFGELAGGMRDLDTLLRDIL